MTSILKILICALFGECEKVQEMRAETADLRQRVERLERATQHERIATHWRPSDVFRAR